jgi:hypothetical protein
VDGLHLREPGEDCEGDEPVQPVAPDGYGLQYEHFMEPCVEQRSSDGGLRILCGTRRMRAGEESTILIQFADDSWTNLNGSSAGDGVWQPVSVDLSGYAGETIAAIAVDSSWGTTGTWDTWYADISMYGTDGYVDAMFNGTAPASAGGLYIVSAGNETGDQICVESGTSCIAGSTAQPVPTGPGAVRYYLADHLGTTTRDFGKTDRAYNIAVLPKSSGGMYVYLYPAQVKAGVYPLGADVRYLLSADGTKVVEKRQMHKTILEYAPPADRSESVAGGYHTHVLSDLPEDTDVLLVLTRQPRVPETVGAGAYIFTIATDGTITVSDRPN